MANFPIVNRVKLTYNYVYPAKERRLTMTLYKEILAHALSKGEIKITFPGDAKDLSKIVEGEAYKTLLRIKEIITDDSLDDPECFMKIEEIVCAFEALGSDGGSRHDFG